MLKRLRNTKAIKLNFTCSVCVFYPLADGAAGQSSSRVSAPSENMQGASERLNSPDPHEPAVTEMFISEENISKMENILDLWSSKLKVSS